MTEEANKKQEVVAKEAPVTHDKCPHCGSTEREGEKIFKRLREEGYISDKTPFSNQFRVQVMDQEKLIKQAITSLSGKVKIKEIVYTWDVCCKCGTLYCLTVEEIDQDAMIQMQPAPAPGFRNFPGGRPGGFNRG